MIHFNELYVTEDGKHLVIDAAIDDMPEYDNFYIDSIKVDVGENCQQGGQSEHAVDVYTPKTRVVGDLDGDGELDSEEALIWSMLFDICDGRTVYLGSDGRHYYNKSVYNDVTDEYELKSVQLSDLAYSIYRTIVSLPVEHDWFGHTQADGSATYFDQFLSYIWEIVGDSAFPNKGTTIGDLTNDGEVNITDINAFIDYVISVGRDHTKPPITATIKERQVRLCLGWNDGLSALVGKDFSKTMFIVTATATSGTDEIVELECGQDITQIVGVAYSTKLLYDSAMKYAANYGNTCESRDATAFIDFLMRYYGFMFALKCGDLCQAQYYWSNYLTDTESVKGSLTSGGCGCHGTYG